MDVLVTSDTWGISGPAFLDFYAALAAAAVVAVVLVRRLLARSLLPVPRLTTPDDIAYLHDGPELTVLTALSGLRVAGCVTSSGRRRVQAIGAVGPEASELARAIHLAARNPVARGELPRAAPVADVLGGIERRLTDAGLLLTARQRRRIRHTGWVLWAVTTVGAIRAIADDMANKPIGVLAALLVVVAVSAAVLSITAPRRTNRGDAELTRLRSAHASLSPRSRPHWRVYGPAGAALGIAIFGVSALWAADPAWAKKLGAPVPLLVGDSGAGSSGGGTFYCGGGASCGGGCGCGGCGG